MTPRMIAAAVLAGLLATVAAPGRAAAPLPAPSCLRPPPPPAGRPEAAQIAAAPVCVLPLDLLEAADGPRHRPRADPAPGL